MGCWGLPEESHYYKNATSYFAYDTPNCIVTSVKMPGTKSFGKMRSTLNFFYPLLTLRLENSEHGLWWKLHHLVCETWWWTTDVMGTYELQMHCTFGPYSKNNEYLSWWKILEEIWHSSALKLHMGHCLGIPKWQQCKTESQVNVSLASEKIKGRLLSDHLTLLISTSLSHSVETSNVRFQQDTQLYYRKQPFCQEEWAVLPSEKIKSLIHKYHKRFQVVIDVIGGNIPHQKQGYVNFWSGSFG